MFKDLNAICKITIIQKLQAKVAVPGEYLAVQDYIGEHMFILKNGKVHLKRTPTTRQKWGSAISKVRERMRDEVKWGDAARNGARIGNEASMRSSSPLGPPPPPPPPAHRKNSNG